MLFAVVDDDIEAADLLATFLEQNGHQVVKAFNGEDARKIFSSQNPDGVFLDIVLPDANGIDLLKEFKKSKNQIPIVMVTGFKDAENVVNAFREGAFDCLLKPFNYEYIKNDILPKIPKGK